MLGKKDDVAQGRLLRQDHEQPVDAHAEPARGRHAVFEGDEKILVHEFGLIVAFGAELQLLFEALTLIDGVVQLGVGVAELEAADEDFETFDEAWVLRLSLGQR